MKFFNRTIVPSVDLPVTLDFVKKHLRTVVGSVEDDAITHFIKAAVRFIEGRSRLAYRTKTLLFTYQGISGDFFIPVFPIQSIESVKSWSIDSGETTIDPGKYTFNENANIVYRKSTWDSSASEYRIRVIAGYQTDSAIPEDLKQLVLYLVADMYRNRGDDRFNLESGDGYQSIINASLSPYFDGQLLESTP